jgi:hypothetical protein
MPETAEAISEKPEVRKELQRATREKPRQKLKARGRDKFWLGTYALILAGWLSSSCCSAQNWFRCRNLRLMYFGELCAG